MLLLTICAGLSCPAIEDGNAQWPLSTSLTPTVSGTCNAGFSGSPSRECDANGQWGAISNACAGTAALRISLLLTGILSSVLRGEHCE